MPRLFRFCEPVFSFGLELQATSRSIHALPEWLHAQQQARRLIEQAGADALAEGKPTSQVQSATFALAAWFDEVLQRLAPEVDLAPSLQMQLFNSDNGPTEFFHHLAALPTDESELREIYWYALALGFRGQYDFEQDRGDGEVAKLLALHAQQLPVPVLEPGSLDDEPLTPQPYLQPDPHGPHDPERRERSALRTVAVVLFAAFAGWWLLAVGSQHHPAALAATPLERQLQTYVCADLSVDQTKGTARVQGFVPTPEDKERVRRDLAARPELGSPDVDLQVRPWPYCEVVSVLKPHLVRNRQARSGLRLTVPSAHDGVLREGDTFIAEVRGPSHDSRLWVDFYTADGAVLHFRLHGSRLVNLRADQTIQFGSDLPASWLVSPPFGTVLVTVTAAPGNLQEPGGEPPPFELATDYLLRLREMVSTAHAGDKLVADWLFLRTTER